MKNVKVYINSTTQTTEQRWGVKFTETSVTALMTPAPKKKYITNKSALSHGKQVLSGGANTPRTDERDVQLTFSLRATSLARFLMQYREFVNELKKGSIDLTTHIWEDTTWFKETYHLNYVSCNQYAEYNGRLAKFVIKFNEPNPENRVVEHSTDIKAL
ncbi:MAG: hypothetical protein IKU16_06040 [Muribaculaceae bacterium]|nr:hypothetical protein [Muribaculaceae bacterium]